MPTLRRRFFALAFCLAAAALLAGCTNTVKGVGRDIEGAGEAIQRTF